MQRKDEREGAHQVRSDGKEHASLAIGLPHEAQVSLLEVAEAAMNQPAGTGAGAGAEIRLLHEHRSQATHRGVAGYPGTRNAAANDQQIYRPGAEDLERRPS
jgi:hypothetical protein